MNTFGNITTHDCVNTTPPADPRCTDPAFALANPDICPATPTLVIKPAMALTCVLGSVQFKAFLITNGVEQDVSTDAVWSTSSLTQAAIGSLSGNATGLAAGDVTISATYGEQTATAELNVLADSGDGGCCSSQSVGMMMLVDNSRSMSLKFSSAYATRLDFAKAAASRFASELNTDKDTVGLITFNDSGVTPVASLTSNKDSVVAEVATIAQTQQKTSFYNALQEAITQLSLSESDLKVIVLFSDGEDTGADAGSGYQDSDNPIALLSDFKNNGGIVMCMGCRASGAGFALLSAFSTGGFFVNAYTGTETDSLDYLSGLKGYICAGNCVPTGDEIIGEGALNYNSFANWNVTGGSVDLQGNGFLDFMPGNGLYVDLSGSGFPTPSLGRMVTKTPITLIEGDQYRLSVKLAANPVKSGGPYSAALMVFYLTGDVEVPLLSQTVVVTGATADFHDYSFSFTAPAAVDAYISIREVAIPGQYSPDCDYGMYLDDVRFDNLSTLETLFRDTFDDENQVFVPPKCGASTIYLGVIGNYCSGYGCLLEPPQSQQPDPLPLGNIETGGYTPPKVYSSTQTVCATCATGFVNVSGSQAPTTGGLIPAMTDYSAPSGTASASSELTPAGNGGAAWNAFDGTLTRAWDAYSTTYPQWLAYDFHAPTRVASYGLYMVLGLLTYPTDFELQGSNDGVTWTTVDTRTGITWPGQYGAWRAFTLATPAFYSRYRLLISAVVATGGGTGVPVQLNGFQLYGDYSYALGPTQVCKTETAEGASQSEADNAAHAAALAAAQAELNCVPGWTVTETVTLKCPTGTCGADITKSASYTSFISEADAIAKATAAATALAQAEIDADCAQSTNAQPITVPALAWNQSYYAQAVPFPSVEFIATTGPVASITVQINDIGACANGNSFQMLLRSPSGTWVILWSDRGTTNTWGDKTSIVFTVDDKGVDMEVSPALLTEGGIYKPNNGGLPPALTMPATTPQNAGDYKFSLDDFLGEEQHGGWSLWVCCRLQNAFTIGGFSVTIT